MDKEQMLLLTEKFLSAWNSHDVDRVLGCYAADLVYVDPNSRGSVVGAADMRRYLTKLFGAWRMHWRLREAFLLDGGTGAAILWKAHLRRADRESGVEIDGMDLVVMEGDRISRNEVYFDRSVLQGK